MMVRRCLLALAACCWSAAANTTALETQLQGVKQAATNHCSRLYSPVCLQFELLSQLDQLMPGPKVQILPGVYLSRSNDTVAPLALPRGLTEPGGRGFEPTIKALNHLLAERLYTQLKTWSVSVYVFGNSTLRQLRSVLDLSEEKEVETGRRHKYWKYMGSALLTLAFSVLSALISKSLTMSILALAMSVLGNRNGFGYGYGNHAAPAAAPAAAFRSPPLQYMEELPEDPGVAQPLVYVNRKAYQAARSDDGHEKFYYKYK